MYKYCTKKMVEKAVRQGREAVIKCASDKWWFFGTCEPDDLMRRYKQRDREFLYLGINCALCRSFVCGDCPLYEKRGRCTTSGHLYLQARDLFDDWRYNPTATNFKKFQAKSRKLARVIERLK